MGTEAMVGEPWRILAHRLNDIGGFPATWWSGQKLERWLALLHPVRFPANSISSGQPSLSLPQAVPMTGTDGRILVPEMKGSREDEKEQQKKNECRKGSSREKMKMEMQMEVEDWGEISRPFDGIVDCVVFPPGWGLNPCGVNKPALPACLPACLSAVSLSLFALFFSRPLFLPHCHRTGHFISLSLCLPVQPDTIILRILRV